MEFVGITAGIDAIIALVTWALLVNRKTPRAEKGAAALTSKYFANYLISTCAFLALISISMLTVQGNSQAIMVLISDLALWVSLWYFVMLVFVGRPMEARNLMLTVLFVLAGSGTLYQLAGLMGLSLDFSPLVTYVLQQMGPLLMYGVWVPSALLFLSVAFQTENDLVRARSAMFAVGLALITFSWAFRLLTVQPSLLVVTLASVVGFELLLGGVIYRGPGLKAA